MAEAAQQTPCGPFDPAVMARTPLMGGLPDEFRCVLTDRMEVRPYPRGAVIYQEQDPARELFILAAGRMQVSKEGHTLSELTAADFFGEVSFLDMQPRGTTVVALEDCVTYVIPFAALRALYQVNVRAYALLVMNLAREVCRRLRHADRLACPHCPSSGGSG